MLFALGMASDPFGDPTMGTNDRLILRRITQTDLSVSAHSWQLSILDGIAWKDGYNAFPAVRPGVHAHHVGREDGRCRVSI